MEHNLENLVIIAMEAIDIVVKDSTQHAEFVDGIYGGAILSEIYDTFPLKRDESDIPQVKT
jgi:hypothetical protein